MLSDKVPYYILDLLQQVPYVYVNGLGRFEAIFHPATIDHAQSQIKPPYIEPDFSADEDPTHDILASFIHYDAGIDPEVAKEAIASFVQRVVDTTIAGENYVVEKFGTFSKHANSGVRFTPDWDAFNLSFSGLEVLDLKPAVSATKSFPDFTMPTPVLSPVDEISHPVDSMDIITPYKSIAPLEPTSSEYVEPQPGEIDEATSRLWWMILSAALVLITVLCGYLIWDIMSNRSHLQLLKEIQEKTEVPTPITEDPIPTEPVVETPDQTPAVTEQPGKQDPVPNTGTPCFVVVGAFANTSNVERMIERIEAMGYSASQIKGGGLTRVAIQTSCDPSQLQDVLNTARASINPEAWIY